MAFGNIVKQGQSFGYPYSALSHSFHLFKGQLSSYRSTEKPLLCGKKLNTLHPSVEEILHCNLTVMATVLQLSDKR